MRSISILILMTSFLLPACSSSKAEPSETKSELKVEAKTAERRCEKLTKDWLKGGGDMRALAKAMVSCSDECDADDKDACTTLENQVESLCHEETKSCANLCKNAEGIHLKEVTCRIAARGPKGAK